MSSTAPFFFNFTATTEIFTRNHVGSDEASAPTGSAEMACASCGDEAASSSPTTSSRIGASEHPNVVQPITPRDEDLRGR